MSFYRDRIYPHLVDRLGDPPPIRREWKVIRGLGRVLRPDGKLIFFELGLSPDPAVQRWQKRLEPVHHWLFQGLYLTGIFRL